MDENYVQGFMDKCAAAGVDAEQLVKSAGLGGLLLKIFKKYPFKVGIPALGAGALGANYLWQNTRPTIGAGMTPDKDLTKEKFPGYQHAALDNPLTFKAVRGIRDTLSGVGGVLGMGGADYDAENAEVVRKSTLGNK